MKNIRWRNYGLCFHLPFEDITTSKIHSTAFLEIRTAQVRLCISVPNFRDRTVKPVATGSRDRPVVYILHKYYLN